MTEVNSSNDKYVTQLEYNGAVYKIHDENLNTQITNITNTIGDDDSSNTVKGRIKALEDSAITAGIMNQNINALNKVINDKIHFDGIIKDLTRNTINNLDYGIYVVKLEDFDTSGPCKYWIANNTQKSKDYTDDNYGWITINQNSSIMILIVNQAKDGFKRFTLITGKGRIFVEGSTYFNSEILPDIYPRYTDNTYDVIWIDPIEWRLDQRLRALKLIE